MRSVPPSFSDCGGTVTRASTNPARACAASISDATWYISVRLTRRPLIRAMAASVVAASSGKPPSTTTAPSCTESFSAPAGGPSPPDSGIEICKPLSGCAGRKVEGVIELGAVAWAFA